MTGAGTLWVSVKPSLEGFGTDLRRQIEQSIPPEIKVKITPDGDPAADGAKQAGAFADAYKARLKAALSDLPKVEITADSSDADRALADIRARMETLRDLRIGVDIDAASAQARLAELEAELRRLAAQSPNVQVRVDAGAAAAELAAFQAELNRLDGQEANVRVDTSQGVSAMGALMTVGLALGPALIPIGAAVAAGLASIGPAALAAAGALGVLGLAFSGIGKAIQAADTAQQQAGANATQSANQQANAAAQIASAQDGVASAERSLAQARAQAADGAVSAASRVQSAAQAVAAAERNAADAAVASAERVAAAQQAIVTAKENAAFSIQSAINAQISAEEALANAQRAEQTAQENLTQARKDAALALQNLTFSVQDNALNQRAADLSLRQAEANLAGLGSAATPLQRDQAQLAVDQAKQRIVELQAQGKQLADQKATADKNGIEGSTQVVAAQNAVTAAVQRTGDAQRALQQANANVTKAQTDGARSVAAAQQALAAAQRAQASQAITSQESIARAETALADARRAQAMQQVTSANSIASAEQGVVSAHRALDSAQRNAAQSADQASTATKTFAQAMAALSPAGRDFVNFYESQLKPKFDELKAAAQTGLLPGLQEGIRTAFPALDQLKTYVGNVAGAMGDLAKEAGAALTSPFWHDFFDFMNRTAGPTIKTLGETFGNFVTGVAGIMQALYEPVFVPIMNWFRDLSVRVRDFGTSAASGNNSTFNSFLQYVKDNGPTVRDIIGELVKLVGNIVSAMAGQGGTTLSVLLDVLRWINGLPPAAIQGLIDLFVAIKLAQLSKGLLTDLSTVISSLDTILVKLGVEKGIQGALGAISLKGGLYAALGIGAVLFGLVQLDLWLQSHRSDKPIEQQTSGEATVGGAADAAHSTTHMDEKLGNTTWAGFWAMPDFKDSAVGKFLDETRQQLEKLGADISKFFGGLPGRLASGASDMKTAINNWWDTNIANPTRDFFTRLPGTVSTGWTTSVWNPTRDFFTGLPGTVRLWWDNNVANPTRDWFTTLPANVTTWWNTNVWNPTSAWFTGLPGTVTGWWNTNVWNPTRDWFTGLPGTITTWWNTNVWNPTNAWFTGLPGTVTSWWNTNVWNPTSAWFTGLPGTVTGWWQTNVANPTGAWFAGLPDTVRRWWTDNVSTPLHDAAVSMWDGIQVAFKDGLNKVIDALNAMTGGVNLVLRVVHVPDIPPIPNFAAGGIVPGYAPGVDSVHAMLSPGEAVLVPELVRSIGPSRILAANAAASGRSPGSASAGFAGGGIIGDIGDWISGAASWVSNGISGIGSLFTGSASQVAAWVGSGVSGLVDQIKNSVRDALPAGLFADMGTGAAGNILDGVVKVVQDAFKAMTATSTAGSAVPSGPVAQVVQQTAAQFGWGSGAEWDALAWIINHESGWNPNAQNPTSTAYGLFQFLNGTWASTGIGKTSDPSLQALAGMRYIQSRYGDPVGAQRFWAANGWYADGAIFNGPQVVGVGEAGPEMLLPLNRPDRAVELIRESGIAKMLGDTGRGISPLDLLGLQTATAEQTAELKALNAMLKRRGAGASITVNDHSGDPTETARSTMLALRFA